MKRMIFVLVGVVGLVALAFSEEFEGIVYGKIFSETMSNSVKMFVKGPKMKMIPEKQLSGTNGYPIIDFSAKKGMFVFVDEKYYMELPLDQMIKNLEDAPVSPKEVGEEKYLDFNARKYLISDKDLKVEALGTKDLKPGLNPFVGIQRMGNEGLLVAKVAHFFFKNGIFPLKIVVVNAKNQEIISIELTSVERQKISDKEFEIPSGFKKFSDVVKEKMKKNR